MTIPKNLTKTQYKALDEIIAEFQKEYQTFDVAPILTKLIFIYLIYKILIT